MRQLVRIKCTLIALIALLVLNYARAQDCAENLEMAQRAYYSGSFGEVNDLLNGCLGTFDKKNKTEAFELLSKANVMLNQDSLADEMLHKLLLSDPFYQPSTAEIISFQNLWKSYEIKTKFNYGIEFGFNIQDYTILQHHNYTGITQKPTNYESLPGFSMGLIFEQPLYKRLSFSTKLLFQQHRFRYTEEQQGYIGLSVSDNLNYLGIPIQVMYAHPVGGLSVFVSAGISPQILLNSSADFRLFGVDGNNSSVLSPNAEFVEDYDTSSHKRNAVFNYIAGAGLSKSFGLYELRVTASYEFGIRNLVKSEERYSDETLYFKYGYVPDDFKMDHLRFSLGIVKSVVYPFKKVQ